MGRHDPSRARRPPDHRAAVGVLAVDPGPRARGATPCCATWASGSCPTRRWATAALPGQYARVRTDRRPTSPQRPSRIPAFR